MDTRTLQIVHEFDNEPTYIVTRDDDHEDIATVEPSTPNAVQVADELVRRWNAYSELVSALEACMEMMEWDDSDGPEAAAYDRARAAITNATNTH
jgi:hypothetical protein